MAVAGSLLFDTKTDLSGFNKGTQQVESKGTAMLGSIKKAVAALGLGALAKKLVTAGVAYDAQIEQYKTSFEVMLGSARKASSLMIDLKKIAAQTPFELTDIVSTTQLLMNYGMTAKQATARMKMLGDISQGNAEKMDRIAMAYGQMSSAGKVQLEDVKQMIEAGFNPLKEISESTGESMGSLYDRISKGTISVDEITASMERSTSKGGKYFKSMEKQSQTLSGRWSTLKDTINEALGQAFQPLANYLRDSVIPVVTKLLSNMNWGKLASALGGIAKVALTVGVAFGAIKLSTSIYKGVMALRRAWLSTKVVVGGYRAAVALLGKQKGIVTAITATIRTLTGSTKAAAVAQRLLNIAMKANPILLVASAIGTLVGVLGFFALKSGNVDKWFANFNKKINEFAEKLPVMIDNIAKNAPKIIEKLITAIAENLPTLIKGAAKIIIAIVKGIIKALPALAKAAPKIIKALVVAIGLLGYELAKLGLELVKKLATGLKNGLARIKEVGANLVTGLWNGITGKVKWIINKIEGFGKSVVKGMKKIFGMKSPPKNTFANGLVTSFGIGEYFSEGMANGIIKAGKDALSAAQTVGEKTTAALQSSLGIPTLTPAIATGTVAPAAALASNPVTAGQVNQIIQATSTGQSISINFTGDLSALGRVLKPVLDKEAKRIGKQQVRL